MINTYSTGQVSGMTMIPIRTIQEYINAFRDNFSETARQRSKGRRFTDQDIDKLQTIKRLRSERVQDDEIQKVLSGEIELKLAHQYSEAEIRRMAANALENYESAKHMIQVCERTIDDGNKILEELAAENRRLQEESKSWRSRVEHLHKWQLWVMKNFPDLNPNDILYQELEQEAQQSQESQEQPRKGFLARLLG